MSDGWRDEARRTVAQEAIAQVRRRLACELVRVTADGSVWETTCPRCHQTSRGVFADVELFATRHACRNPKEGE